MAVPTRPTTILNWVGGNSGNTGVQVAPTAPQQNVGWGPSQKPAAFWMNWILGNISDWLSWINYNIGAGLGSGGSALTWQESAPVTPNPAIANNIEVYEYAPGNIGQALVAILEVPTGYNMGTPITIYNRVYSGDTSGTVFFQTLSTLIRVGVDKMDSTTNQHISTNVPLTLTPATQWVPTAVQYDITDTGGLMNGVGVSPGDLIIVELLRGADTAPSKAMAIVFATIPSFG